MELKEINEKLILHLNDKGSLVIIDNVKEIQVVNFFYNENNRGEFTALIYLRGYNYPINITGDCVSKFRKWYLKYLEQFPINNLADENLFGS